MPVAPAPTLQALFPAVEAAATVALFGTIERKAIEKLLAYGKNDRPVIRCQVRQKDVPAKPEEIIRQLWIYRLLNHYKYPLVRILVIPGWSLKFTGKPGRPCRVDSANWIQSTFKDRKPCLPAQTVDLIVRRLLNKCRDVED